MVQHELVENLEVLLLLVFMVAGIYFLKDLMMHAAVGTALGGVMTTVGEPQNLLISRIMEWEFVEFFVRIAPVGLIGLSVIVLATVFTGVTEEHRIGHAFEEALPFTALLVVFFGVVAIIKDQGLFQPVIE